MKNRFILPVLICAAVMTACSASDNASGAAASPYQGVAANGASYSSKGGYESYDSYDSYGDYETADTASGSADSSEGSLSADSLKKEMLVYSCTMSIDTLDFDSSLGTFKNTLDMYGGFIEQENYSDGGSQSGWYNEHSQKWQSYTATLRVPSKNYDAFCEAAAQLGYLRSKNARVENVSREYSDLETTLEIYEAKEERYIALLAGITDDEYAVAIEKELTELQIQIAAIKTRMNEIQTDVAYSYVYMTINEVKEYVAEPVKTDTFGERLAVTLKNAASGFLSFLEGLLFVIIYLAPYLVLIGIIVFIVVSLARSAKRRKAAKRQKMQEQQPSAAPQSNGSEAPGSNTVPESKNSDNPDSKGNKDSESN